jgi:hypothetical protein
MRINDGENERFNAKKKKEKFNIFIIKEDKKTHLLNDKAHEPYISICVCVMM